jgi:N-acetylglucosamine-6-phosphate deacetylase
MPDGVMLVRGGVIERVGSAHEVAVPNGIACIDDEGGVVAPGFIDIHIHGSGGHRVEDNPIGVAQHVVQNGTTFFLPTMLSNELGEMEAAARRLNACAGSVAGGATIGGVHLEGPFLNPRYGAQRGVHNIEPDAAAVSRLIDACGGRPRMVTIAPERRGALAAIEAFRGAGALVSIGHSDAAEDEYRAGRAAGVSHATHVFNAMPPKQWMTAQTYQGVKPIGVEELILADDGVSADIMCDATCAHVHAAMLRIAIACKGPRKLSLITDAMPAAGRPPGEFRLADGQSVYTAPHEDVARLAGSVLPGVPGVLCGSVMSMCGTIRNWIRHTGAPLEQALTMASEAPARAIGVFDRKGSIASGKDADLVWLDADHRVTRTMVRGRVEHETAKVPA